MQSQQNTSCSIEPSHSSVPSYPEQLTGYSGLELLLSLTVVLRFATALIQFSTAIAESLNKKKDS